MKLSTNNKGFIIIYLMVPLLLSVFSVTAFSLSLTNVLIEKQKSCRTTLFNIIHSIADKEKQQAQKHYDKFLTEFDAGSTITPSIENITSNHLIQLYWEHSWFHIRLQNICQTSLKTMTDKS